MLYGLQVASKSNVHRVKQNEVLVSCLKWKEITGDERGCYGS